MIIKNYVYKRILNSYPVPPPENGGILGTKNGVVCEYYHDSHVIDNERAVYVPNTDILNRKIAEWTEQEVLFSGIVHSHMSGQETLSGADIDYIRTVFGVMPEGIRELYFPIVIPEEKQLISFVAKRNDEDVIILRDEVHVIL